MNNFGFVGMGNMAQAIAAGFVASKKIAADNLFAFAPNQKKLNENAKKIGFVPCTSNVDVAKKCDVIFIACKPHQIEGVLSEIGGALAGKILVSIAAKWTLLKIMSGNIHLQFVLEWGFTMAMVLRKGCMLSVDMFPTAAEYGLMANAWNSMSLA